MRFTLVRGFFLLTGALLVSAASARADVNVLTFEGLQDNEAVSEFYNGGKGSLGSGPGLNVGISFVNAYASLESSGNFINEPSPSTTITFNSGLTATMNVNNGFDTGFSFYYASPFKTGSITVYSGLNETGTVLATLPLATTPGSATAPNYNTWIPVGVKFNGTAHSVGFGGAAMFIGFDNVTIGTDVPINIKNTPAPGSLLIFGGAMLSGLVCLRQRKARLSAGK